MDNEYEHYIEMYGCSLHDLINTYDDARRPYMGGTIMLATSILSDAQERIALGDGYTARQYINRAKWVINQGKDIVG
tara:strand:- start:142 stop:372 length:231 start_codon:yes stop_codon:yes gene_type:complete